MSVGPMSTDPMSTDPITTATIEALAAASASTERAATFGVRDVALGQGRTLALITIDNGHDHTVPTTFGPNGLLALRDTVDAVTARVEAGEVVAVALIGKPFIFAAGADLRGVGALTDRDQALAIARFGHMQWRRLGELAVPSFGFVNGVALGGGLEAALHCTYRTVSRAAGAIGLPECSLGLIPGWGGATLVPQLVGVERAVELIVANPLRQNRLLKGGQLTEVGLADVTLDAADFLETSIAWAADVLAGKVVVERAPVDTSVERWDAVVAAGRTAVRAKLGDAAPAPLRALDLIAGARTADRDAGFAAEDEALADLVMSPQFRAGAYAFDLVQRRAKKPAGAPDKKLARPVRQVGVVGAGLMARQLALLFVRRLKVPVVLRDVDADRTRAGVQGVHDELERLHGKGRITSDDLARYRGLVTGSSDVAAFAGADLVIEAVFERMDVKQQVFAEVEAVVGPDCILATNTSSLSVTQMASGLHHPERVVGIHFFNPVAVLPLVELIRAEHTDDATTATALAVCKELGKSSVLVRDAPAFVVNRVLLRLMGEVHAALDEGTPAEVADTALAELGLPMTPFQLLELVGPGVAAHVAGTLAQAFPDRFAVSPNLTALVTAGLPGIWSLGEDGRPYVSDQTRAVLVTGDNPSTAEQVRDRAVSALAQEIRLMLDEGVVAAAEDVDLCLLLGAGWPFHLGGITPYLDRTGTSERVMGRRFATAGAPS